MICLIDDLQLDEYFRTIPKVEVDGKAGASQQKMVWVTDGQLPLRQCLHPESCTKGFDLPSYYNAFFDLRKEFRKAYPSTASPAEPISCIQDMLNCTCSYLNFIEITNDFKSAASQRHHLIMSSQTDNGRCSKFSHPVSAKNVCWAVADSHNQARSCSCGRPRGECGARCCVCRVEKEPRPLIFTDGRETFSFSGATCLVLSSK
jgi:hypothetical protein